MSIISFFFYPQSFFVHRLSQINTDFILARKSTAFFKKTRLGSALIFYTALRDYGLLAQVHGLVSFFNISIFNISILLKEELAVATYGGFRPFLGDESPVVELAGNDGATALYLLGEIITLVAVAAIDDATVKRILGYAGTSCEQFPATIASITVEHHLIPFLLVKRLTV